LPTIPDIADILDIRQRSVPDFRETIILFLIGGLAQQFRVMSDHCRKLGRVRKIETLQILQICPRSSQAIGDIYDFEFSSVDTNVKHTIIEIQQ